MSSYAANRPQDKVTVPQSHFTDMFITAIEAMAQEFAVPRVEEKTVRRIDNDGVRDILNVRSSGFYFHQVMRDHYTEWTKKPANAQYVPDLSDIRMYPVSELPGRRTQKPPCGDERDGQFGWGRHPGTLRMAEGARVWLRWSESGARLGSGYNEGLGPR